MNSHTQAILNRLHALVIDLAIPYIALMSYDPRHSTDQWTEEENRLSMLDDESLTEWLNTVREMVSKLECLHIDAVMEFLNTSETALEDLFDTDRVPEELYDYLANRRDQMLGVFDARHQILDKIR
jgi:hypothetical protein